MSDDPNLLDAIARSALANAALWGGLGGLTNALASRETRRGEVLRMISLGMLVTAGTGSIGGAVIAHYFPTFSTSAAIPAGSLAGVGVYLTGVFGGALIELALSKIRNGRLPGAGGGTGDAP